MRKIIFWIVVAVLAFPAYFVLCAVRQVFYPLPSDSCGYDMEQSRTITCGEAWAKEHNERLQNIVPENNNWAPDAPKKPLPAANRFYDKKIYY